MASRFPDRETWRDALVIAIQTDITRLSQTIGYNPVKLSGVSPLCAVWADPRRYVIGTDEAEQKMGFVVAFFVRRDDQGGGADNAADIMDALARDLADCVSARYNARFTQDPDAFYDFFDGIPYQVEFHYLELDTWV